MHFLKFFLERIKMYVLLYDLIALNIASVTAAFIAFYGDMAVGLNFFLSLLVFLNLLLILLVVTGNKQESFVMLNATAILNRTFKLWLVFSFVSGLFIYILSTGELHKHAFLLFFLLLNFLLVIFMIWGRFGILNARKKYHLNARPYKNILLFADLKIAERIYNSTRKASAYYNILGIFSNQNANLAECSFCSLFKGNLNELIGYIKYNRIHEIFCDVNELNDTEVLKLVQEADKKMVRIRFLINHKAILNRHVQPSICFGNIPVMAFRPEPLEDEFNQIVKRIFDVFFSLTAIILILSWLIPILAILIKLESKGPVFFVQVRSGKNNKPFKCYKFRSMRTNRDSNLLQATKNDSRLTKTGRLMRKTSIDELPQFLNVLKGEMSVVGPRPHMLAHTRKYKRLLDSFMVRHFLKPGITGYAQVSGCRGETRTLKEMENRVRYDVTYMENWSFFLDVKIIFLTLYNALKGEENAY